MKKKRPAQRATRSDFWTLLFMTITPLVFGIAFTYIGLFQGSGAVAFGLFLLLVSFISGIFFMDVCCKRLHDMGQNSATLLIYLLAGGATLFSMPVVFLICFAIFLYHLGCIPGTYGINEYGEDPLYEQREQKMEKLAQQHSVN